CLPFHAKEKFHVYHSPARSELSMSVLYCKTSINVNNICFNHCMEPAIFGTRIATLNCLHETLDQHSAFVYCCRSFKPMQRATIREGEREKERVRVCVCASERPRSTVLAISYFTYFCVGNMLLNMLKIGRAHV